MSEVIMMLSSHSITNPTPSRPAFFFKAKEGSGRSQSDQCKQLYYSTLFNCGQIVSPLGSYILNVQITGRLYDREANKDLVRRGLTRLPGQELTCLGRHCFRLPFIVLLLAAIFGALVNLILMFRTREFYKGDVYAKFKDNVVDCSAEKESDFGKKG